MKLINTLTGEAIINTLSIRSTFLGRLRGYLFSRRPDSGHGVLLMGVRHIHTLFMRFPLDIYYLDSSLTVLEYLRDIQPNRFLRSSPRDAKHVLETPHDPLRSPPVRSGDRLTIRVEVS